MNKTIQLWVWWWALGGLERVARHRMGNRRKRRQAWTFEQEAVLSGRFRTALEVMLRRSGTERLITPLVR